MSIMKSAQTVYYGPKADLNVYPSVGSVSANESVKVIWKEVANGNTWAHIEYSVTGTTQKKRGYVSAATVNITETVSTYNQSFQTRYVHTACSTFLGPDNNANLYPTAGSVNLGETVKWVCSLRFGEYVYVEYDISGGKKKRAYINANNLGTVKPTTGEFYDYIANGWRLNSPWRNADSDSGKYYGHLGNDLVKGTTKIKALADGVVQSVSTTKYSANGYTVTLRHVAPNGSTYYSFYAHMNTKAPLTVGAAIKAGDDIHDVGWGGLSSQSAKHVHLGVYTGPVSDDMYGYNKVNGTNTLFDDHGTGIWEYQGRVFYDALKVVSTKGAIIR